MVSSVTKSDCDIPALNHNVQSIPSVFEPPRVTKIGLKTQEVRSIRGKRIEDSKKKGATDIYIYKLKISKLEILRSLRSGSADSFLR